MGYRGSLYVSHGTFPEDGFPGAIALIAPVRIVAARAHAPPPFWLIGAIYLRTRCGTVPKGIEYVQDADQQFKAGQTYGDLPAPAGGEKTFVGWFTEQSGGSEVKADTKVMYVDTQTLYAHWN